MKNNQSIGQCRLCGKMEKLSYEHVPPKAAFNKSRIKMVAGKELVDFICSPALPWETFKAKGVIKQNGSGGYYLCQHCNSTTGSWYDPYYLTFVKGILHALTQEIVENEKQILIETGSFQPLPIIKQIILMFFDINPYGFGDQSLRDFVMNKECNEGFNYQKYKIYCYLVKGPLERRAGLSGLLIKNNKGTLQTVLLSEIATLPIGFTMYVDMPSDYSPKGCDITEFTTYHFDDKVKATICLPILETNSWIANDFRTKQDIESILLENPTF